MEGKSYIPVDYEVCLLCECNTSDRHCLSEQKKNYNDTMAAIIIKHFWFTESDCKGRYICFGCWTSTLKFHEFFTAIQAVHSEHSTHRAEHIKTEPDFEQANEVYVMENLSDSDTALTPAVTESFSINSTLKEEIKSTDMPQQSDARERPSPFPGIGLSLSRMQGRTVELICHDCFRQASDADSLKKAIDARYTFDSLLKHYWQEHNKAGYAICCNRKYTSRTILKSHLLSHNTKTAGICIRCNIKFRKRESFDAHNLFVHTAEEKKVFKCGQCDMSFPDEHMRNSHRVWHEALAKTNILCKICNIFFATQPALRKHDALYHPSPDSKEAQLAAGNSSDKETTEDRQITSNEDEVIKQHCTLNCSACDFSADTFQILKQHTSCAHFLRNCSVVCCERTFSKRQTLYEHCLVLQNPDCFRCDECGNNYASSRSLQDHKWRIHTPVAERPFCCDVCGATFVKDYLMKKHMSHHLAKEKQLHYCNECKRSVATAAILKTHRLTHHGGVSNWICDICGRRFNGRKLFENHRLTHSVEGQTQLKHQCEVCKKWLRNKKSYQQHRIRFHLNSEPVTCKHCGKVSVNASALKTHVYMHHTSRPTYPCTLCNKILKTALSKREHEAIHTGLKLHKCPWCPRSFSHCWNMYKHKKKGHPQEWATSLNERFGWR